MSEFKLHNGKLGVHHCEHTSTGYECHPNFSDMDKSFNERVVFYVRHVVGSDGRPYTEMGFTGLFDEEMAPTLKRMKEKLKSSSISEVMSLSDAPDTPLVFAERQTTTFESVALRMNAGLNGISLAISAMGELIEQDSREFVLEQEKVDGVLYESIMHTLGPELSVGPGGKDEAAIRAQAMADQFQFGMSFSDAAAH
jgi:hypothetical protein